MGKRAWFAPKSHGIGAAWPISWEGWAVVVGFVVATAMALLFLQGWPRAAALPTIAVIFATICWRTTAGGWRNRP